MVSHSPKRDRSAAVAQVRSGAAGTDADACTLATISS
jgi:hypothetical protein